MADLAALIARLAGRRISVVGDVMLDHFIVGRVDRISPEAPVPVVRFEREEFRLGGAANVAHNIVALGAECQSSGVVGSDAAAAELGRCLRAAGLSDRDLVVDAGRPDHAQDARRHDAQPAGRAHRLRTGRRRVRGGARRQ